MKKYIKFVFLGLFVVILVWTFIFLWKKSQPEKVVYQIVQPTIGTIQKKQWQPEKWNPGMKC